MSDQILEEAKFYDVKVGDVDYFGCSRKSPEKIDDFVVNVLLNDYVLDLATNPEKFRKDIEFIYNAKDLGKIDFDFVMKGNFVYISKYEDLVYVPIFGAFVKINGERAFIEYNCDREPKKWKIIIFNESARNSFFFFDRLPHVRDFMRNNLGISEKNPFMDILTP